MKVKEMSKEILRKNLVHAVEELLQKKEMKSEVYKFIINPIIEANKSYNGSDDLMRFWVLSEENVGGRILGIDDVIDLLGGLMPLVPIWINISFIEMKSDSSALFQLDCSLRFRKPSLLRNAETGHAPFAIVI